MTMFVNYLLAVGLLASSIYAQFGFTENDSSFIVDAGSANSLVTTIEKASCDITSIVYRGTELQGPQSAGTHIGSGFGTATVSAETINDQYIKVTCDADTLTHYVVVVSGDSNLYMATHITAQPEVGELRYIARLDSSVLPEEYPFGKVSTTSGSTSTIEGSDVFVVDGETRSKFYSSERFIDDHVHCVAGDDVHACFVKPQHESSSGGPFFRDINSNKGGEYTSLTHYMNSGHAQTEAYRIGLHGPYSLSFTRSGIPKLADYDFSFFEDLDIEGYVPESGRGYVSGTASGVSTNQTVVHWFNDEAQYWTYASEGTFTSPAMKPGTYTMKLYSTELEVASQSVDVAAGETTISDISNALEEPSSRIWTIGTCDGQPTGFRNAANQLRMHPSDDRMEAWSPGSFSVGTSSDLDMPMALFKAVNSPQSITFDLDAADTGAATLRVRTTLAFASGRPSITVNDWEGDAPAAPTKIDSRGVTRGAYRGYNEAYEFDIPEGTLVSGSNNVDLSVISGSSGEEFLSPNFILDCIELYR